MRRAWAMPSSCSSQVGGSAARISSSRAAMISWTALVTQAKQPYLERAAFEPPRVRRQPIVAHSRYDEVAKFVSERRGVRYRTRKSSSEDQDNSHGCCTLPDGGVVNLKFRLSRPQGIEGNQGSGWESSAHAGLPGPLGHPQGALRGSLGGTEVTGR